MLWSASFSTFCSEIESQCALIFTTHTHTHTRKYAHTHARTHAHTPHSRSVCKHYVSLILLCRLIRLTSPNLNYMIGVGAMIFYIDVALLVTPSTNPSVVSGLCNITLWLAPIGYSLCFGPILAKMMRVYYIFGNPTNRKNVVSFYCAILLHNYNYYHSIKMQTMCISCRWSKIGC